MADTRLDATDWFAPRHIGPSADEREAMLQAIGKPRQSGKGGGERITDGTISPTGTWIALRTTTAIVFYRTDELLSGNWREATRVSLTPLGEPQGEGIAFADEKSVYLVGEGGGKARPGTFGRVACVW